MMKVGVLLNLRKEKGSLESEFFKTPGARTDNFLENLILSLLLVISLPFIVDLYSYQTITTIQVLIKIKLLTVQYWHREYQNIALLLRDYEQLIRMIGECVLFITTIEIPSKYRN